MRQFQRKFTVEEIVSGFNGTSSFIDNRELNNVSELSSANENSLCFYENTAFQKDLENTKAGLIIVPEGFDSHLTPETNLFFVKKPYFTFNQIVGKWLDLERGEIEGHIHPSAVIDETAVLEEGVVVRENVVIRNGVTIGKGTIIEANCVIEEQVKIGANCHLYPNCTVYAHTEIGNRVILHSSSSIGVDGFGYLFIDGIHHKINHVGKVVIEDDVEIGANTCVDRGTIGKTVIGRGTKLDNLVQVGHNCSTANSAILCAQVGLAGNTKVGNYVFLAGQVGAAGHMTIGDGAMIGAQSGLTGDVPPGAKLFGTPAIDANQQKRIVISMKRLPEIAKYFNKYLKEKENNDKE